MKLFKFLTIFFIAAILGFIAWHNIRSKDEGVAIVNNQAITVDGLQNRIDRLSDVHKIVFEKNRREFLDNLVVDELIYQEAKRQKVHKNPSVIETIGEARKKIIIGKFINDNIDKEIQIDREEIRAYYDQNKELFKTPKMYRASHILVTDKNLADELRERVVTGESFELLAEEHSKDMTKNRGGDIGFFTVDKVVPEFANACVNLKFNQISPVVKTQFGFHIIKLTGIKESEEKSLEETQDGILRMLTNQKRKKKFNALIDNLKNEAVIKVNDSKLNLIKVDSKE